MEQASSVEWGRRAGRTTAWPAPVFASAGVAVAGVLAVWGTAQLLAAIWRQDPLKSIGVLVPFVCLVLVLRAWRSLGWATAGSWWGVGWLAGLIALVHLRDGAVLELVWGHGNALYLPPPSLVVVGYAAAMVLALGGWRLLHVARFPVLLMAAVNPVPHAFARRVDLPLQHAAAAAARGMAGLLGFHLGAEQLRLMFVPDFGMWIAPGCDGMRGALALGLMALVAGYVVRMRNRRWAALVLGALALGYLFNLLRLCLLVLFYVAGVRWVWLQPRAEAADYGIGAGLFLGAAVLLSSVVRRWAGKPSEMVAESRMWDREFWPRWGLVAALVAVGSLSYLRGMSQPEAVMAGSADAAARFPASAGRYRLQRTWEERDLGWTGTGEPIFEWAEYRAAGAPVVSVGIAPTLGAHDPVLCHVARGEDWLWSGPLLLKTRGKEAVGFSAQMYEQGSDFLEATTVCSGERCGQSSAARSEWSLVWSRPGTAAWVGGVEARPIPVLLRAEVMDRLDGVAAQPRLVAALEEFASGIPVEALTRPFR